MSMINKTMTTEQLESELLKSYFEHIEKRSWSKIILIATALVVAYMLWWDVPRELLLVWLLAVVISSFIEKSMITNIARIRHREDQHKHFYNQLTLIVTIQAVLWGAGAYFIWICDDPVYDILVTTVMVTIVATVGIQSAACLRLFYLWLFLGFTPFVLVFVMHGSHVHNISIVLMLLFIAVTILTTKLANNSVLQLIMLKSELAQEKNSAEAANVAKSKFLAAASHDLRQPLHALTLFVGVLKQRCKDSNLENLADNIRHSADSIEKLLNSLLDVSKLDAGIVKPDISQVDIYQLLSKLENEYTAIAQEKGLRFHVNSVHGFVSSDASLLETILRNLLSNAIRYTEQGEVSLDCQLDGDQIKILVADTGAGIPMEQQQAVFQEFYQLDNNRGEQTKGLGLGLSIVKRLAQLLSITIHLESQPNKGSTFSLILPFSETPSLPLAKENSGDLYNGLEGMSTLIIDDDPMIREAMLALLGVWGVEGIVTESTAEAIGVLQQRQITPDMLIVDYELQNNELGTQSAQAILACCNKDIPVLVMTGSTEKERLLRLQSEGYIVMHKPLQPDKLLEFLQKVCQEKKSLENEKTSRPFVVTE